MAICRVHSLKEIYRRPRTVVVQYFCSLLLKVYSRWYTITCVQYEWIRTCARKETVRAKVSWLNVFLVVSRPRHPLNRLHTKIMWINFTKKKIIETTRRSKKRGNNNYDTKQATYVWPKFQFEWVRRRTAQRLQNLKSIGSWWIHNCDAHLLVHS